MIMMSKGRPFFLQVANKIPLYFITFYLTLVSLFDFSKRKKAFGIQIMIMMLFTERDLDCNQSYFNASEVREKEKHRDT